MNGRRESEPTLTKGTTVERTSEREMVVTRTINGPAHIVFEAFTKPELFQRWWVPKTFALSLLSCELDVRVGGTYRLVFSHSGSEPMAFFGKYIDVTPHSRLVWTNEEGDDGGAVTTELRLQFGHGWATVENRARGGEHWQGCVASIRPRLGDRGKRWPR